MAVVGRWTVGEDYKGGTKILKMCDTTHDERYREPNIFE